MGGPKASPEPNRVRVLYVSTSSLSVRLVRGQLGHLRRAGFEVTVISSPGEELASAYMLEGVQTISMSMAREMSPWQDLLVLWRLWRIMRRFRPSITNVSTPKAGLLGGLAAWLGCVPCRIYTLRGLRYETTTGFKRLGLLLCERIACRCAHRVICVSQSLRQKAVAEGVAKPEQMVVLASGSSNGVEESHFAPRGERSRYAVHLRRHLGIPLEVPVVGFVGRFTRDKGIPELVKAYSLLRGSHPQLRLLLVGDFEKEDAPPPEVRHSIENDPHIIRLGFVPDTAPYYHVMDVLALPTRREGLPNVVLEAQAAGKAVVAARSTGVMDAMTDGVTGILVPVGNAEALAEGLALLLKDVALAKAMGSAGRERVLREFRQERVWDALLQEYLQLLRATGLPLPKMAATSVGSAARASTAVVPS